MIASFKCTKITPMLMKDGKCNTNREFTKSFSIIHANPLLRVYNNNMLPFQQKPQPRSRSVFNLNRCRTMSPASHIQRLFTIKAHHVVYPILINNHIMNDNDFFNAGKLTYRYTRPLSKRRLNSSGECRKSMWGNENLNMEGVMTLKRMELYHPLCIKKQNIVFKSMLKRHKTCREKTKKMQKASPKLDGWEF